MTERPVKKREITPEELDKMSLSEKTKRYAADVVETERSLEKDWYAYDFLLGNGSLGYPFKPSKIGLAVERVAGQLGLSVAWNMENSWAKFEGRITPEAVEEAFYPIWEESERMKKQRQS